MLSASSPVTSLAGIACEPSGRLPASSSLKSGGYRIWSWMRPRMPLRFRPSRNGPRNAASRSGPTVPFVPARESTWQEPHFCAKSFLPAMRSGFELFVFVQAARSVVAPAASAITAPRRRLERERRRAMRARTLSTPAASARRAAPVVSARKAPAGARLRARPQPRLSGCPSPLRRARQLVPAPLGGGDHARRDTLPRVPLPGDRDERGAGVLAQVLTRVQPRDEPVGQRAAGAAEGAAGGRGGAAGGGGRGRGGAAPPPRGGARSAPPTPAARRTPPP